MFSVALLSLMLPVANPVTVAAPIVVGAAHATRTSIADPSVRISLDRKDYEPGDQARVTVRVRDDGYLLVLRLSPDGYVRVLFPLDPGQDNFVRGDGSYEIRGRGDRNAFTVSSSSGTGTVYAAWSTEPFRFDDYVLGDHWDYRVLDGSQIQGDPEAGLTELAQRMATGHFDYDLVSYSVAQQVAYSGTTHYVTMYPSPYPYPYGGGCYDFDWCGYGPNFSVSFGFGWGRFRSAWYDPYFYDPFYRRPYYRHGRYYPGYYGCYGCGYRYPSVIVVNPPSYRGRYPYQWKPGSRGGGGGAPGVQYRPRTAYASAGSQAASPLFVASKYRRVADGAKQQPVSRRRPGTVFGAPVTSGLGAGVGPARRTPGEVEVIRGGVRGGPVPPRRAGESDGVIDLRGSNGARVAPRSGNGVAGGSSSAEGGARVAAPRRAEPLGANANGQDRGARAEPRRIEPRAVRAEPRAEARPVEPRAQPQRVERSPAPVQRAEPRSAPVQRAEPRSAPRVSQPRSAPAPRVSQPRSAPRSTSRSAPAPRSRRP